MLLLVPAIPALGQRQVTLEELAQRRARNAARARYTVVLAGWADGNRSLVAAALATKFGATLGTDLKGLIVLELPRGEAVRIAHDPRVLFVEEVKSTPQLPVIPTSVPDRPGKSGERRMVSPSTLTPPEWTSGAHSYDGAGNIVSIGPNSDQKTNTYVYDALSRLISGSVHADGIEKTQSYQYDAFGNLTDKTTTGELPFSTPADPNTNRLTAATTAQYDAAGNLVVYGANTYFYDALGMVRKIEWSSGEQYAIYTPDEERIGYRPGGSWRFTLRDPAGKVLRQYFVISPELSDWFWEKDYVYRGGALLSSVVPGETFHHHLDHLGTPRLSTRQNREQYAALTYYAYGEEFAPGERSDDERLKFTGHERDFVRSDLHLDHMHARNYNPNLGRFLSVDAGDDVDLTKPQSWNKYSYVRNNPINMVDPDGKAATLVTAGIGALTGAGFQIGINMISGDDWDTGLVREMAIGAGLGLTGVGIAKVFDKGSDAYHAAKAAQAAQQLASAAGRNVAFEIAAQGGKHSGYLRTYAQKPADQIAKAVASHQARVAEHAAKLKDPAKFAERWAQMSARERAGLLRRWEKDMNKHRELADVLRGLLR